MADIKSYNEHWRKIENLPGGGQSSTIKTINILDEKNISVVKILNRQNDIERRARMRREAVNLSTLDHPNLPKLIDSNTDFWKDLEYKLFIAMEFIPGQTLSEFDFSILSLNEKIQLVIKICETIEYCHNRGIVHRDIKPDNIILRNNDYKDPVIVDFGISFNFNDLDDDNLTPDGQQLGNRFFILPEQKVGEVSKRDIRSDVTCVVGIFYYLLTNEFPTVLEDEKGQKPHQRPNSKKIINSFSKSIKDVINNIFDIGFTLVIDYRFQTTKNFMNELRLIEKMQESKAQPEKNLIEKIKSESSRPYYREKKIIKNEILKTQKIITDTISETSKKIGNDWLASFSSISNHKHTTKGYGVKYIIANRITNVSISIYFKIFITGNEIVVHSLVEGKQGVISEIEVFRQNMQSGKNWDILKLNLTDQYLEAIFKEMENSK